MDHFGIGTAIKGAARIVFQSARASGRTMSLVNSVKDGDRIVFTEQREADRVKNMCKERGVRVTCVVARVREGSSLFSRGPGDGRTIFDHSWVEQFYIHKIKSAAEEIDYLEKQLSRGQESPSESERARAETMKWRV